MTGKRVDTHAHIFVRGLPLIPGTRYVPKSDHTAADYLAELDAHDVDYGVIVAHSAFGTYNDFTLEALRAHPRLRGTCIVDPTVDMATLRAMDAAGMAGIRFMALGYTLPDIASAEYAGLFRKLVELDWHVHMYAEGEKFAYALPIFAKAGLKVVVDHFGHPDAGQGEDSVGYQAALRALANGRTFVKLSAAYRFPDVDVAPLARRLLAEAGTERLLWGSDWPFTRFEDQVTYGSTQNRFKAWVPDAAQRDAIHATARKLYRFQD